MLLLQTPAAAAIPAPNADSQSGVLRCCIADWEPWACGGLARSWHWGSSKLRWATENQGQKLIELKNYKGRMLLIIYLPRGGCFPAF